MSYDLKSESDVKEYIEKLGIEYRFGCYSEKKPEVCHLLGDYLEGIKKDFDKAAKVYRSNCDDYGFAKSCLKFGHYSFLGKGKSTKIDKGDPKQAYDYYLKGCNKDDPDSCLHSGLLMVSKSQQADMTRDVVKGLEALKKSCSMNNATACFYLSGMFISGVMKKEGERQKNPQPSDFIIQKDMAQAFEFATKACDLDNMYACANLSQMYARGDGTEKNEKKAEQLKKKALEMQDAIKKEQAQLKFGL